MPGQLSKFRISKFEHTQGKDSSELIRDLSMCVTGTDVHGTTQPEITSLEVDD